MKTRHERYPQDLNGRGIKAEPHGVVSTDASGAGISDFYPLPGGDDQYTPEFIRTQRALYLGETRQDTEIISWVAVSRNCTEETQAFLTQYHQWRDGSRVMFLTCSDIDMEITFSRLNRLESTGESFEQERTSSSNFQGPGQRMLRSILLEAVKQKASDLHFEPMEERDPSGNRSSGSARVRVLVNGQLREMRRISRKMCSILVNGLRVLASLEILSHSGPQDGSFSLTIGREEVRMRVSILSSMQGLSASIRILNPGKEFPSPAELGFKEHTLRFFQSILCSAQGLILFSGPTGCGKTTSMYGLAGAAVHHGKRVISIEEPVEIILPGVEQIEANSLTGMDYGTFLPSVLRRKPDVLIIGEIRNQRTAELALDAGLSGHLVLSTIHAPSAGKAEDRLKSLGIKDPFRLGVLKAVVGQRLIHLPGGGVQLDENLFIPGHCSPIERQQGDTVCTIH